MLNCTYFKCLKISVAELKTSTKNKKINAKPYLDKV